MNSTNQKSLSFLDRSPWSDEVVRHNTPGKPPRSPKSPYRYLVSTVSSPAFDSLGKRTRRKRAGHARKDIQTTWSPEKLRSESKSPATPSRSPHESDSVPKTPPKATAKMKEESHHKRNKKEVGGCFDTPELSSPASMLSASSQPFVPSESSPTNMTPSIFSAEASTTRSTESAPYQLQHGATPVQVYTLMPEGDELEKMVEALLHIVDKNVTTANKTMQENQVYSLYLPSTRTRSPPRQTQENRITPTSFYQGSSRFRPTTRRNQPMKAIENEPRILA